MRLRLPRRRIWRGLIYLLSLLLVLIAADLILVQVRRSITPGYDTTRIVSPLLPDGQIDYLKYLDGPRWVGVTPENNAAPLFLLAVGRWALPGNQPADGITDKLGMAHLPEEGNNLIQYEDFIKEHGGSAQMETVPQLPATWPATITPLAEQWVAANERPLKLLVEASKRPRFFIPFDGGNRPEVIAGILLTHIKPFREVARLLLTRAVVRLNAGDVAGFTDDVLATHRLARLLGQNITAIERMEARTSLDIPACRVGRVGAESGKLSTAQARSLAVAIAGLGELPRMTDTIDGERFMILDFLQTVAKAPPERGAELFNDFMGSDAIGPPNFYFRFAPLPYEAAMRHMNHCYDGALAAARLPDYPKRIEAMKLWEDENTTSASGSFISFILSPSFPTRQLLLSVVRMEQNDEKSRAELRLTQIALGLAAYKADRGAYPHGLEEIAPNYLASVPNDPFSERPFVYAPTPNGYALHSVGPNMVDDSGGRDDIAANGP